MKRFSASYLNKFTAAMMVFLGFSACSDDEDDIDSLMYGTPYATFEIKGIVTTADNTPVENAAVVVKNVYNDGKTSYPIADTVRTDVQGKYIVEGSRDPWKKVRVIGFDKAKQLADSVDITLETQKDKADGWYAGHETGTADLVLKKSEK